MSSGPLLRVEQLRTTFPIRSTVLRRKVSEIVAVNDVSFDVAEGQVMGIVGESGSGKSTLARTLIGLEQPQSGHAYFDGVDLIELRGRQLDDMRKHIQMVFQDPQSSLNPRLTVLDIISEAWRINPGIVAKSRWEKEARHLLTQVGLDPDFVDRYPHQFSGGQRQRVGIARALALRPRMIICDEAVSALDVAAQAQVLDLLLDLQDEYDLTYLFISHDLSVVRHVCDEVLVMHFGDIVERGVTEEIFTNPTDNYTRTLLSAVPKLRPWLDVEPDVSFP